jgi:hypothetical protein
MSLANVNLYMAPLDNSVIEENTQWKIAISRWFDVN